MIAPVSLSTKYPYRLIGRPWWSNDLLLPVFSSIGTIMFPFSSRSRVPRISISLKSRLSNSRSCTILLSRALTSSAVFIILSPWWPGTGEAATLEELETDFFAETASITCLGVAGPGEATFVAAVATPEGLRRTAVGGSLAFMSSILVGCSLGAASRYDLSIFSLYSLSSLALSALNWSSAAIRYSVVKSLLCLMCSCCIRSISFSLASFSAYKFKFIAFF